MRRTVGLCGLFVLTALLLAAARPVAASGPQFVQTSATHLALGGQPWYLYGASTYGTSNPGAGQSIADEVALARSGHLNTLRIVNMFDERGIDANAPTNEADWVRVDQLLAAMRDAGLHAVLDLSAFRNHLQNRELYVQGTARIDAGDPTPPECVGKSGDDLARCFGVDWCDANPSSCTDPYSTADSAAWNTFLGFVANRVNTVTGVAYKNDPTIAIVSFAGEPNPPNSGEPLKPTTQELTDFYARVFDQWKAYDSNHLVTSGGLLHIDWQALYGSDSGIDSTAIWALPNEDVLSIHDYFARFPATAANDTKAAIVAAAAQASGKPWITEEFGFLQQPTDGATTYTEADRGAWFRNVYAIQQSPGAGVPAAGVAFWNLGPEIASGSHDVNPSTPATWAAVVDNAPASAFPVYIGAGFNGRWSPDGSLIAYIHDAGQSRSLEVAAPDGSGRRTLVPASAKPDGFMDWSPDGSRVAFDVARPSTGQPGIGVVNSDGSGFVNLNPTLNTFARLPSWSGDGTRIAFDSDGTPVNGQTDDIFSMKADGTDVRDLTPGMSQEDFALWSPDGTKIAFQQTIDQIYVMNADGSGLRNVTSGDRGDCPCAWSPDSSKLLYRWYLFDPSIGNYRQDADIFAVNADGSGRVDLTPNDHGNNFFAGPEASVWSPDGSRLTYTTDSSGSYQVMTVNADGSDPTQLTNYAGANSYDGSYSPDGTRLAFDSDMCGDFAVFVIPVSGDLGGTAQCPPTTTAPGAPTNVAAAAGDGTAAVSWLPPATDGGSAIASYTVTPHDQTAGADGSPVSTTSNAATLRVTNGHQYTFTVTATNAVGTSAPSAASNAVTPQAGAPPPASVTQIAPPNTPTSVTTGSDPAATGGLSSAVTVPAGTAGGVVTVNQGQASGTAPSGYTFGGVQVDITAPAATVQSPLVLVFTLSPPTGQPLDQLTLDAAAVFRTEGGAPAALPNCDATSTNPASPTYRQASPDPCVFSKSYVTIGGVTYIQATVLTSSASRWNTASPAPLGLRVSDSGYAPKTAALDLRNGAAVWTFAGTKPHSVTDATGLGVGGKPLFDSGARTSGTFAYQFPAAGTYSYLSTPKGDKPAVFAGSLGVPPVVSPANGGTATSYDIKWARVNVTGCVFDVQYRFRPAGSTKWKDWTPWQKAVTTLHAAFTPKLGKGTYAFEARLRNSKTGRASGFSPDAQITVS